MNKKPTIAELRELAERARLVLESADYVRLNNAITELESLRGETPRVADGAQQVIRAQTDGSKVEILRQPGMTQLPESGEYALGIQQYPDDPTLVEMTLYHEQTGVIAWRTAWNVKKAKTLLDILRQAMIQVRLTQECHGCGEIKHPLHLHKWAGDHHPVCDTCCKENSDDEVCLKQQ